MAETTKMFVHVKKGSTLNLSDVAASGKYYNSVVFDENTGIIYARGGKYGDVLSAMDALQYFSSVAGNTGTAAPNASQDGSVLNIKGKAKDYVETVVDTNGVTIQGTDRLTNEIADAKAAGTAASSALETYKSANDPKVTAAKEQADKGVQDAAAALAEAQKKVASVTPTANKGIEVVNTDAKNPTVGIKIDDTTAGNVTLSVGENGLKANVTLPTVDYPVTSVTAMDQSAVKVDPTTKDVKVGLNLDGSGNVTLSQSATGLKAAIDLSSYATKDDLSKLKDMVVSGGEIVTGTSGLFEGVEVGKKYLKLTIANSNDDVYIAVSDLVDVYTGENLFLDTISTESAYTAPVNGQSVDKAISLLIKGIADAQAKANEAVNKAGVTSFGGWTGEIKVKESGAENGSINFTIGSDKTLNGTVAGLGTAAYTNTGAYATSEQGTKADSALLTVSKGTDGEFVTTTVSEKTSNNLNVSVALTYGNFEGTNGVAKTTDVKTYVDSLWAWEEV